ncbi:MAG: hypothetical protein ACLRXC_06675 [[Clostridium] leptum]
MQLLKSFTPYDRLSGDRAIWYYDLFPEMMLEHWWYLLIACSVINVIANPVCELLIATEQMEFYRGPGFHRGTYVALAWR